MYWNNLHDTKSFLSAAYSSIHIHSDACRRSWCTSHATHSHSFTWRWHSVEVGFPCVLLKDTRTWTLEQLAQEKVHTFYCFVSTLWFQYRVYDGNKVCWTAVANLIRQLIQLFILFWVHSTCGEWIVYIIWCWHHNCAICHLVTFGLCDGRQLSVKLSHTDMWGR